MLALVLHFIIGTAEVEQIVSTDVVTIWLEQFFDMLLLNLGRKYIY